MASAVPQSCSPRLVWLLRIYCAALLLLCAAVTVLLALAGLVGAAMLTGAVGAAAVWLTVFYPQMYYDRLRYARSRDRFRIDRGVLWQQIIFVPTAQIQYVLLRRTPLDRLLGLASLTAVTSAGRVTLRGLPPSEAARLRMLLERRGDRAVS